MPDTDRERDELVLEIQAENARLIEDYLLYVLRPRDIGDTFATERLETTQAQAVQAPAQTQA